MSDFFEKFKELEEKEKKELDVEKPLEERITFHERDIFQDGKIVFTVPIKNFIMDQINVLGIYCPRKPSEGIVYAGTGQCCHGHVYRLSSYGDDANLTAITAVDTNVYDILPVDEHKIIVTGIGCSGKGVRLINLLDPKMTDILTTKEFEEKFEKLGSEEGAPSFHADIENKKIYLRAHKYCSEYDLTPILEKHTNMEEMIEACKHFMRIKK